MIPYLSFFAITLLFTYISENKCKNKTAWVLFSLLSIVTPALLAGFRDDTIGTDIQTYVISTFNAASNYDGLKEFVSSANIDIVFASLMYLSNMLFDDISGAMFIISLFTIFPIYWALFNIKRKISITLGVFLFLLSFYNLSLNIMRQSMALSVCLLAFSFIITNKYKSAVAALIVAYFSHSTSILFIAPVLIYLYYKKKISKTNRQGTMIWPYMIILPIVFLSFDFVLNNLINYGLLSSKYEMYSIRNKYGGTVLSSIFVVTYSALSIITYMLMIKRKTDINYIFGFICTYSTLAVGLLSTVSIWAGRLAYYFQIVNIILYPYIINNLPNKLKKPYTIGLCFIYIFYWWYVYIINNNGETYPYTSKILGIE